MARLRTAGGVANIAGKAYIVNETRNMNENSTILLPLDFDSADSAYDMAARLSPHVYGVKVGLQLINSAGFEVIEKLQSELNVRVFYDCKFHDIPNTVMGASEAATNRGVWMFNVHAAGGIEMLKAAIEGARRGTKSVSRRPLVIAVTVLTSVSSASLRSELGVHRTMEEQVVALAKMSQDCGLDGVVASPLEIKAIREACGPDFLIVTPGVRPANSDAHDQKRMMTPMDAVSAGSDYLVIGRPITHASSPETAAEAINASLVQTC